MSRERIDSGRRRSVRRLLALLLGSYGLLSDRAQGQGNAGDAAVRRIRAFYDALLDVMKQADKLGRRGRYDRLAPVIRETFDLPAMTRIAVGPDWNAIAPDLQAQLVDNFARMTIATYASRFDGYSGERFDVDPVSEARSTGRVVHTKLVPADAEPVTLDYLLRGSGDAWKAVDVYLTGTISELATRRTEFAAILKSGGPQALVESLKQQADREMRAEPKVPASR